MSCRGCFECLLKLLNFLLTLVGLAMVGYGIYLLVEWKRASDDTNSPSPLSDNHEFIELGRPMLLVVSLSSNILDKLPKACFGGTWVKTNNNPSYDNCLYMTFGSNMSAANNVTAFLSSSPSIDLSISAWMTGFLLVIFLSFF